MLLNNYVSSTQRILRTGQALESKAKTRSGERKVFLDHDTAALLREHRKNQLKVRLKAGGAWEDHDLVFCQDDGRPSSVPPRRSARSR